MEISRAQECLSIFDKMNEKTNSRQQRESGGKVQNIVSRRSRIYVEEEQIELKNPGPHSESRTTSGDEMDMESLKTGDCASQKTSEAVVFRPVAVDLGMDISNLFPSRIEDRDQQGM